MKVLLAIVFGGIATLLAAGYFLGFITGSYRGKEDDGRSESITELLKIAPDDHLLGPRDADVVLFEYGDVNCPFCRYLHAKMLRLVENKNHAASVAWVYRHFPLYAVLESIDLEERALECAAAQGGDSSFFAYLDKLVADAVEKKHFTHEQLMRIAEQIGLDARLFSDCLASDAVDSRILRDHRQGATAGVSTIPHTFLAGRNGVLQQVVGNKPLSVYEGIINLLQQAHP